MALETNLPQGPTVVKLIKNGAGFVSPKMFNGYVNGKKGILENVHFRRGKLLINNSVKNKGISYKLQPSLLKQELDYDDNYEVNWKEKMTR